MVLYTSTELELALKLILGALGDRGRNSCQMTHSGTRGGDTVIHLSYLPLSHKTKNAKFIEIRVIEPPDTRVAIHVSGGISQMPFSRHQSTFCGHGCM